MRRVVIALAVLLGCGGAPRTAPVPAATPPVDSAPATTPSPNAAEPDVVLVRRASGSLAILGRAELADDDVVLAGLGDAADLHKLDRAGLVRVAKDGGTELEVFVHVDTASAPSNLRDALAQRGLTPATVAGDVVTGRMEIASLSGVLEAPWVIRVELAQASVRPR